MSNRDYYGYDNDRPSGRDRRGSDYHDHRDYDDRRHTTSRRDSHQPRSSRHDDDRYYHSDDDRPRGPRRSKTDGPRSYDDRDRARGDRDRRARDRDYRRDSYDRDRDYKSSSHRDSDRDRLARRNTTRGDEVHHRSEPNTPTKSPKDKDGGEKKENGITEGLKKVIPYVSMALPVLFAEYKKVSKEPGGWTPNKTRKMATGTLTAVAATAIRNRGGKK